MIGIPEIECRLISAITSTTGSLQSQDVISQQSATGYHPDLAPKVQGLGLLWLGTQSAPAERNRDPCDRVRARQLHHVYHGIHVEIRVEGVGLLPERSRGEK